MICNNDPAVSLYKDIRLSEITKKLDFPLSQTLQIASTDYNTLIHQQFPQYHQEVAFLRSQVIRLSQINGQLEASKEQYAILEDKYQSLLRQNINLHFILKQSESSERQQYQAEEQLQSARLEQELSEANHKISDLLQRNETLQKQNIILERQIHTLKARLQMTETQSLRIEGQYQIITAQKLQLQQIIEQQRKEKQLLLNKYDKQLKQIRGKMQENQVKFRGERHTIQALQSMKLVLEQDIRDLRQNTKGLQQALRNKQQQTTKLCVKINQLEANVQQHQQLKKTIQLKDAMYKDMKQKFQRQSKDQTERQQTKLNALISQNQNLKSEIINQSTAIENLKINNNTSVSTIQSLQSQLHSMKDSTTKLQLQNTKLQSALFTSRVETDQSRRKDNQFSRISSQMEFFKNESSRLKEEVSLVKRKSKEMQYNYRTLIDHVKQKESEDYKSRPRQSYESSKSMRSHTSRSKETHHAEINLAQTTRLRSSLKSRTQLGELAHLNQYQSVIESKLLKPSLNRNDSLNQNVMKRCRNFLNR